MEIDLFGHTAIQERRKILTGVFLKKLTWKKYSMFLGS